jgi:hypothetical protein
MTELTQRAQRLIDEFEEGEDTRHGIANVLQHLAVAWDDPTFQGVHCSILEDMADELTAPSLLDRALAGDRKAARQFLHEAGFTDASGNWLPHFQSLEKDND